MCFEALTARKRCRRRIFGIAGSLQDRQVTNFKEVYT